MKGFVLCLVCVLLALNGYCQENGGKNLIVNGDFEAGDVGFTSNYYSKTPYAGAGRYAITNDAAKFSSTYFQGKGEGKFMAVDGSDYPDLSVWEQTVRVKPETEYSFSCWLSTLNTRTGSPAVLEFYINNKLVSGKFNCPRSINYWVQFQTKWTCNKEKKAKIRIVLASPRVDGNDFGLDKIRFIESPDEKSVLEATYTPDNVPVSFAEKIAQLINTHTQKTKINTLHVSNSTTKTAIKSTTLKKTVAKQTVPQKVSMDSTKIVVKEKTLHIDSVSEKPIVLNNLLFSKGSPIILASSFKELNQLVDFLKEHTNLKIEIFGHTDNIGDKKKNLILSEDRAKAVGKYLIDNGINQNRISTKGFGGEKPIDNTGSPDGRKKNRRVEFQIIKQKS